MDSIISLGQKNTLSEYMILSGADNRPPMLDKDLYDSWKSRMELYIQNKEHKRMILESVEHGPLIWPTVEENGVIRTKKYVELSATEKIQTDYDMKATNIILQCLPADIYSLGESLHTYYLRFTQLINDINIYKIKMEQFQVNTKFLNSLPPEWSKFMTDVKLVKDLHTSNYDQLHAYLEQHELYANEVCLIRDDPITCLNKEIAFLTSVASHGSLLLIISSKLPLIQETKPLFKMAWLQCNKFRGDKGDRHMARQCTQPKRPRNAAWCKEKAMLAEAQKAGQMLDEEQLVFLANPRIPASQAQTIIPHNAAFQTKDLDTYDSNCDDLSTPQAVLMANISNYGFEVILEKRFTPQQELSDEQAFWLRISNPTIKSSSPPVKVEVLRPEDSGGEGGVLTGGF
uniref:Integrase, catalytic region, zinc finger, CCHC-type, peptidase aspartic, catalytic n=1 Tax=Tanacetum cinerariifolium TaxID=118510 RepID=A0A6L2NWY9_TANCI|nr:hypothetical protein [Tanacetum cinerariifolium]